MNKNERFNSLSCQSSLKDAWRMAFVASLHLKTRGLLLVTDQSESQEDPLNICGSDPCCLRLQAGTFCTFDVVLGGWGGEHKKNFHEMQDILIVRLLGFFGQHCWPQPAVRHILKLPSPASYEISTARLGKDSILHLLFFKTGSNHVTNLPVSSEPKSAKLLLSWGHALALKTSISRMMVLVVEFSLLELSSDMTSRKFQKLS